MDFPLEPIKMHLPNFQNKSLTWISLILNIKFY